MKIKPFDHMFFMKKALEQAKKAYMIDEVPVGAVIVCKNEIIARAHNYTETLNDATAHAEMQAFTAASDFLGGKYLNECYLYVTLEPCFMCAGASYWTQIGNIFYGAKDSRRGFSNFNSGILHPKTNIHGGLMQSECSKLLLDFFKKKR